jgi:hypothetical protein
MGLSSSSVIPQAISSLNLNTNTTNQNLSTTSPSNINVTQPTTAPPNVYEPSYSSLGTPAANTTSNSGISGIIQNLVNSGAFQSFQTNPYAPSTSYNPVNVPYGLQQESMFHMNQVNPYTGNYAQTWNPYGNNYQGWNSTWNQPQNSNVAPPPNTTGPNALAQLNNMFGQTPPSNA